MDGIELEPLGGEKSVNEKENKQINGVTFGKYYIYCEINI